MEINLNKYQYQPIVREDDQEEEEKVGGGDEEDAQSTFLKKFPNLSTFYKNNKKMF